ncbi:glycosyltransferase family 39 protein [Sulfurovum sp. NBC37-1]|uniref:glycosyltransferase family 39 protein n=1 Tax=Sulfurovum sp. (strain NBC37-1) TaxID=387093 RepID=UPI000158770A|nr:glycosyltransferase family 39 protein [Sulfurovum sp. NBC37-1]BAF71294.1 hypothetical protein SUN_0334 [Sulfurovum sp. NBC37-1]
MTSTSSTKFFLILTSLIIFLIVGLSRNHSVNSDPKGTLLTAQSIIENQTIKLDNYENIQKYGYQIYKKNDHYYYYFPLGSSISSIPFVWVAKYIFSLDMNKTDDDTQVQKIIIAVVAVLIFLFLFKISTFYFNDKISIIIAASFWSATSLSSTLGQGLWSQDFATLYAAISVYLGLCFIKDRHRKWWAWLGLALFMAYLTRPTMSLLTISIILFLFFNHQKALAVKVALLVTALLVLFVLFSLHEYNQLLPDYYLPKRLESQTFWTALYGNLLSPSRGILIFSPFLFIFVLNAKTLFTVLKNDKTLIIFASWIILHLIIISKFPHWWAGWSYGPRFMIDVLIPIYLLFVILLYEIFKKRSSVYNKLNLIFLAVTVPLAIYINTYQGLYNPYTKKWNTEPNIDQNPYYLFDWKYPQFLHSKHRHEARRKEFNEYMKHIILFDSPKITYSYGWSFPEKNHIWSLGDKSALSVKLENKTYHGTLLLNVGAFGKQKVKIYLNNTLVSESSIAGYSNHLKIDFDPHILKPEDINTIRFEYSDPHRSENGDRRILAMALKSLDIE